MGISDEHGAPQLGLEAVWFEMTSLDVDVPSAATLVDFTDVVVFGRLLDGRKAALLGAACKAAVRQSPGMTIAYAYPGTLSDVDELFLRELDPDVLPLLHLDDTWRPSCSPRSSFAGFITEFGLYTQVRFGHDVDSIVATVDASQPNGCAYRNGHLVVVPYQCSGSGAAFMACAQRLVRAILDDDLGAPAGTLPTFLIEPPMLRLHGEQAVLDDRDRLREELAAREEQAASLLAYRQLLGFLDGLPLEALVRACLDEVLAPAELKTLDLDDVGKEDFWIVEAGEVPSGGEPRRVAVAESKACSGGVTRPHVNQVTRHRADADLGGEFPGLLVVNQMRGREDIGPRREDVPAGPLSDAVRMNVTILRTWDLYWLVSLARQDAERAAQALVRALNDGGGWLKVEPDGTAVLRR